MPLCCVDITIGARIVAVFGLLMAAVVVMELSSELVSGVGDAGVAVLLGLSMDEMDSRQRQTLHDQHHGHHSKLFEVGSDDPNDYPTRVQMPFTEHEHNVVVGFLVYAVVYAAASALLAYASIVILKWGALPFLILHVLSIASQAARLIDQVSQYAHFTSEPQHHLVINSHPFPRAFWEQHMKLHEQEHAVGMERTALAHIAMSVVHLVACAYMWLVVLVAHREWATYRKPRRMVSLGDEGFSLSRTNLGDKQLLSSAV